ncbi:unnamed protein product [Calypogeia fissa]
MRNASRPVTVSHTLAGSSSISITAAVAKDPASKLQGGREHQSSRLLECFLENREEHLFPLPAKVDSRDKVDPKTMILRLQMAGCPNG